MIAFWIIAAFMLAAALALVIPPLLGRGRAVGVARDQLNIAIYKDRLGELALELENEVLSQDQYETAKQELQRDLLLNTGGDEPVEEKGTLHGRWVVPVAALGLPLAAIVLYLQLGNSDFVDLSPEQRAAHSQSENGEMDMATVVERLNQRLADNPEDMEGWVMLGRSLAVMKEYAKAAEAYARAQELAGDVPQLLTEYAEALAMAQGGLAGRPTELITRALEQEPTLDRALWLAGIAAAERQEFAQAVDYWERLMPQLEAGSETAAMVQENIDRAREMAGMPPAEPPVQVASGPGASVAVSVAPELAASVPSGATLFVMARDPEGGRMPIAVVRRGAAELPLSLTLDDRNAMIADKAISGLEQVTVVARISASGNAMGQSGDLEGEVTVPVGNSEPVALIINRRLP